jgi:hypothetical protein
MPGIGSGTGPGTGGDAGIVGSPGSVLGICGPGNGLGLGKIMLVFCSLIEMFQKHLVATPSYIFQQK